MVETEDNIDKTKAGLGMNVILEEMLEIMVEKIVEENIEIAIEMTVLTEAGMGLEKGHFLEIVAIIELKVQATVDPELAQIAI